jgi:hypothetical protein
MVWSFHPSMLPLSAATLSDYLKTGKRVFVAMNGKLLFGFAMKHRIALFQGFRLAYSIVSNCR